MSLSRARAPATVEGWRILAVAVGSSVVTSDRRAEIPAVVQERLVDPVGCGDAYRPGSSGASRGIDAGRCRRRWQHLGALHAAGRPLDRLGRSASA